MKFRTILCASAMVMATSAMAQAPNSPSITNGGSNSNESINTQPIKLSLEQESRLRRWWLVRKEIEVSADANQVRSFPSDLGIGSSKALYVQKGNQLCLVSPSSRTIDRCRQ